MSNECEHEIRNDHAGDYFCIRCEKWIFECDPNFTPADDPAPDKVSVRHILEIVEKHRKECDWKDFDRDDTPWGGFELACERIYDAIADRFPEDAQVTADDPAPETNEQEPVVLFAGSGHQSQHAAPDLVEKARIFFHKECEFTETRELFDWMAEFAFSVHADLIRENGELKEKMKKLEAGWNVDKAALREMGERYAKAAKMITAFSGTSSKIC